ncbi:MinD-like ATPase involved in chromosome partitioning or flagellar assembly [Agromyces ramosus]|uniref:MinD-like ATPase involved in chromosome partitioning or flagellar assembly n=1 Tax=Agromyces ramosus TaxID=33879 RepID=A0A4Q7MEB0_9MICO|nr:MinD/ParA family protein [Agromyces ramosus]RZS66565.1 MinD-like ATPase involved in chromosome partitioning or flagellar assembly [Agromyces ramosus]
MADDMGDEEMTRRRAAGGHSTSADRAELAPSTGAHAAEAVPDSLNIRVDLPPAPRPEMPEDEVAVAIDDVAVNPGSVVGGGASTTSVEVVTPALAGSYRSSYRRDPSPYSAILASDASRLRRERVSTDTGSHVAVVDVPNDGLAPAEVPETSESLTADRLIDLNRTTRPAPHGGFNRFLYEASLHLVNLGDSAKVRAHKELSGRIQRRFEGGARFVPVLTRKGGVGKTTITALLGMALADARDDRIIAIDANPDRGTLAERVDRQTRETVRDVVTKASSIGGYTDFSGFVSRDETRLDILASDTDPTLSEAFDDNDYNVVAGLAARYYSLVLTDCGTGIVHSVMRATLQRADSIVVVSGGSVDEARLASETLTWLEANGYGELVRNAVVAINLATQGTHLVKVDEIEAHFQSRVREIVRIPYDPQLAAGSVVHWDELRPVTQHAARELAALVVEGLPVDRGH